jgi:hypothetical protein
MRDEVPVLAELDRVDQAAGELHRELGILRGHIRATRRLRGEGLPLSSALSRSPGPASHEAVAERAERYVEALRAYRCAVVRHLVDEEGWSLTEVAGRIGCARQVVSRLYHAYGATAGTRPRPKLRLRGRSTASGGAR